MAIAQMKKLTLIALKKDRSQILKALQRIGAVHVTESKADESCPSLESGLPAEIEQKLAEVRATLAFLGKYDKSKKSMLSAKPAITLEQFHGILNEPEKTQQIIREAKAIDEQLVSLRSQKARIINRISALKPYLKFDAPLELVQNTKTTRAFLGLINSNAENILEDIINRYDGLVYIEKLDAHMEYLSIFAVAHTSIAAEVAADLKTAYFSEFSTGDYTGTPAEAIQALENEILHIEKVMKETEKGTEALVKELGTLKTLEDYYATELERARAEDLLSGTAKTFSLEGWVIAGNEKKIEDTVLKYTDLYYLDFRDPFEDEKYPVALLNNRLFRPYEAVIEMYSLPDSRGIDPTVLIAPFYFIFYGMMVSDAGYGIVLTIFALLMLRIKKPDGMFRKILGIISMTGISTLIWGSLYGGWFGFSLPPLWFNPMDNPMMMLILCIGLGLFHVLTGLVIGAVVLFKRGQWVDALCDKIIWLIFIVGLVLLVAGGTPGVIGRYMAIAGVAGIVLTNGRGKKGVLKKFMGGLSALYGSTGYLSDVLSYSRLFGMGLATGVIALVFNTIAGMMIGQWYGYIFAAVIFLVGHVFNIGINALGAYVHSCRLMYIEYFSKFYEDGGKAYKPLAYKIKNYRLEI